MDFITDLPQSDGNTCILVIIDRFSKFCGLIPLQGLPTALEIAELLFNWVFHQFGLPEDSFFVPRDNILDPILLEEFHTSHPDRPAPRGRGRPPRRRDSRPSGVGPGGGGTVTSRSGSSHRTPSPEY